MRNFTGQILMALGRLTLGLLLHATAVAQTAPPNAAPATPKAFLPYTSYDFGTVYKGEIISQVFVIKNFGNADLVIESLSSS